MLFKLSLSNIRRSLRDYAIYFFTLITGVSVFYVFNAISGQAAAMQISAAENDLLQILDTLISGTSVFVAFVLGLLIVYASRFLMKRRSKEFAVYMTLGMSKGRISAILLVETVIIGCGSLAVGLITGIALSQLMSALIASLFDADMSAYRFSVSGEAIFRTVVCFAVMYMVVMLFNSIVVTKMKLIDLLRSGKRPEQIKLKSPFLCAAVFVFAAVGLGWSYYNATWLFGKLNRTKLLVIIAVGAVSTFCIFWSLSGMMLRTVRSVKKVYYSTLNSFTFRQLSSKINTTIFSMTVICLMLFITICTLTSAFSIRRSTTKALNEVCPADFNIEYQAFDDISTDKIRFQDMAEVYEHNGFDINEGFRESVHFHTYADENITLHTFLGEHIEDITSSFKLSLPESQMEIVRLGDYNRLMELFGREPLSMEDDEYILLCNFAPLIDKYDSGIRSAGTIKVFGNELHPRFDTCTDGFITISFTKTNFGKLLVPDCAVNESGAVLDYFIGNFDAESKADIERTETMVREHLDKVIGIGMGMEDGATLQAISKYQIRNEGISTSAIVTFLGLYIGLMLLLACGAILALKELAESTDSAERYEMLRKMGVDESDISRSLFRQTGLFFLLPLLLACFHSVFGMKFAVRAIETLMIDDITGAVLATFLMILLIYGGYFFVTYFCSKSIIKEKR